MEKSLEKDGLKIKIISNKIDNKKNEKNRK